MSSYPNNHVFIVKVQNKTYVAFLSNQDHSRVKFFHNDEVIPASEIRPYIKRKYGKEPEWIRGMGSNPFAKPTAGGFMGRGGWFYARNIENEGIRWEISESIGDKPSEFLGDYEANNDDFASWRKESKVLAKRRDEAMKIYNQRLSRYPSFERHDSVTDSEICSVMEWYSSNDKEPVSTPNYSGVLDF